MEILFKHHKWMELTHGMTLAHFREDCSLSESSLQRFEHTGHVLEFLAGELLGMVDDVVVHLKQKKRIVGLNLMQSLPLLSMVMECHLTPGPHTLPAKEKTINK